MSGYTISMSQKQWDQYQQSTRSQNMNEVFYTFEWAEWKDVTVVSCDNPVILKTTLLMTTRPDAQSAEIHLETERRCTCRALPSGIQGNHPQCGFHMMLKVKQTNDDNNSDAALVPARVASSSTASAATLEMGWMQTRIKSEVDPGRNACHFFGSQRRILFFATKSAII